MSTETWFSFSFPEIKEEISKSRYWSSWSQYKDRIQKKPGSLLELAVENPDWKNARFVYLYEMYKHLCSKNGQDYVDLAIFSDSTEKRFFNHYYLTGSNKAETETALFQDFLIDKYKVGDRSAEHYFVVDNVFYSTGKENNDEKLSEFPKTKERDKEYFTSILMSMFETETSEEVEGDIEYGHFYVSSGNTCCGILGVDDLLFVFVSYGDYKEIYKFEN